MRKHIAVARNLPFQCGAERIGIDRDQQQIFDAGKMLGRGRPDLRGGGEMDEAVAGIDVSAAEHTRTFRFAPKRLVTDLIDAGRHGSRVPPAYRTFRRGPELRLPLVVLTSLATQGPEAVIYVGEQDALGRGLRIACRARASK